MENNLSNKPIDKLNTYTEVKTENINNTESVTTVVLVETSYLFLAIITFVILLVIKKLSTKYHILQKYGITEKNVKIVLEYINRFIKDIIHSKLKRENIQIDFIEDNIKKSTVKDTSSSLQSKVDDKISNITKVGNKLNNTGDEK